MERKIGWIPQIGWMRLNEQGCRGLNLVPEEGYEWHVWSIDWETWGLIFRRKKVPIHR